MFSNKRPLVIAVGIFAIIFGLLLFTKIGSGASNFSNAVEKGYKLKSGTYEIEVSSNEESETATFTNPSYKIIGTTDGTQHSISLEYNNNGQITKLENVAFIDSKSMYIKAAPIMNFMSNTYGVIFNASGIEDKWLTIPLPSLATDDVDYVEALKSSIVSVLISATKDESAEKDGSKYVISKDNGDIIASFINKTADLIISQLDVLSKDIYNIASKFSPKDINDYVYEIAPDGINTSEASIKEKISELVNLTKDTTSVIKRNTNAGLTISSSFTGKGKRGVYEQLITAKSTTDSGYKTINILYKFTGSNKVAIVPPETSACFNSDSSKAYVQRLILEIYKIINNDAANSSKEGYEPKYIITTTQDTVTCTRDNDLFSEKIVYTISKETVANITVTIASSNQRAYNALVDYYKTIGYGINGATKDGEINSATLTAQQDIILKQYASITNVEALVNTLE